MNEKEYKNFTDKLFFSILPVLEEFEKKRKKELNKLILKELGLIILLVGLFFILNIIFFCIAAFVILSIFYYQPHFANSSFKFDMKYKCIDPLLKLFGNIEWNQWYLGSINDSNIENSGLFGVYNEREDDDYFSGTYKNTKFQVLETKLKNVDDGKNYKWEWTVFKGVIITIPSNKPIKNKTIVTTKCDINTQKSNPLLWVMMGVLLLACWGIPLILETASGRLNIAPHLYFGGFLSIGYVIIYLLWKRENKVLNKITLEDVEFNKKYNAYSNDEVDGRYLLTTAFMERFKNLHTAFGARKAKCSFFDDKIMFSISTRKNLFEVGSLFFPVNTTKQINVFLKEISAIYELIEYFKLNEKTGL